MPSTAMKERLAARETPEGRATASQEKGGKGREGARGEVPAVARGASPGLSGICARLPKGACWEREEGGGGEA